MFIQAGLLSETVLGVVVVTALGLGMVGTEAVRRRLCEADYPDYNRHLTYAEHMFFDSEFDRAKAYVRNNHYPLWFRFAWIRDIAVIIACTLLAMFGVYFAEYGIKMFTGGLIETSGGNTIFATKAYAPYLAALLGICLGVWATTRLSLRSDSYREFAQYVASLSKKRGVVHIEHFYRAGLMGHERLKLESDLLVMIHERYTHLVGYALKLIAGLTALVFVVDIARGLL